MAYGNYYTYQPQVMSPSYMTQPRMDQVYPQFPQQGIQNQPQNTLSGRFIDDISTVNPSEVAMDGSVSVFVKRDLSEIYAKRWNQNGLIETCVYKVQVNNTTPDKKEKTWEEALKELSDSVSLELVNINEKLDKALETKTTTTSTRGGGSK